MKTASRQAFDMSTMSTALYAVTVHSKVNLKQISNCSMTMLTRSLLRFLMIGTKKSTAALNLMSKMMRETYS